MAGPGPTDPASRAVVTVLLPVKHFQEGYLREAVDSVLDQTSTAWRLIVITERSEVRLLAELLEDSLADPRIDLVINEGRRLAGALNTGMRHAVTDFVAILLGDDLWEPEAVEVLGRWMAAAPEADFFHSSRRYIDGEGRPISGVLASRASVHLEDFAAFTPVKHLLCWRKDQALLLGGMDESLEWAPDDFDFPWTMAEHGARFVAIPECLYVYRDHREGYRLTTHLPRGRQVKVLARVLRKHGLDRAAIRRRVGEARRSYLRQALYASRLDRSIKRLMRADPRRGWREPYPNE
jgi:glycosyltransferase involved in cell wall biosynthesis